MPKDTRVLAGNFKIGAELGFARDDADIAVLAHPLNDKHGRAPQLASWGLLHATRATLAPRPLLLVAGSKDVAFRDLLAHYHALCRQVGPLPTPRVLNIDHGRQRFLLFALSGSRSPGTCTTPAIAFIDKIAPIAGADSSFDIAGWAIKDAVGLRAVEVLLDGRVVAQARYGEPNAGVADFWKISTDPNHPRVYFRARIEGAPAGAHWLGLRLHGADGSVEDWLEQKIEVR